MQNVSEIRLSRTAVCIVNPPSDGEKSKDAQHCCCLSFTCSILIFPDLFSAFPTADRAFLQCLPLKHFLHLLSGQSLLFSLVITLKNGMSHNTIFIPCHQITASHFALTKYHLQNCAFHFYIFSSGHFPEVWLGDLHDLLSEISVQLCFSINCFIAQIYMCMLYITHLRQDSGQPKQTFKNKEHSWRYRAPQFQAILQNNSSKKMYGIKIDTYINRTKYKAQRQTHVHIVN